MDPALAARLSRQAAKADDAAEGAKAEEALTRAMTMRQSQRKPSQTRVPVMDPGLAARLARQASKAQDAEEGAKAEEALYRAVATSQQQRKAQPRKSVAEVLDPTLAARLAKQASKVDDYAGGVTSAPSASPRRGSWGNIAIGKGGKISFVANPGESPRPEAAATPRGVTGMHSAPDLSRTVSARPRATTAPSGGGGFTCGFTGGQGPSVSSQVDPGLAARLAKQASKADGTSAPSARLSATFEAANAQKRAERAAQAVKPKLDNDLEARLQAQANKASGAHSVQKHARMLFSRFDSDGNGSIDGAELAGLLDHFGIAQESHGQVELSRPTPLCSRFSGSPGRLSHTIRTVQVMGALSKDQSTLSFEDFYKWFELGFKVDELDNVEKNLRLRHAARNDAMRTMRAASKSALVEEKVTERKKATKRMSALAVKERPQRSRGAARRPAGDSQVRSSSTASFSQQMALLAEEDALGLGGQSARRASSVQQRP